MVKVAISKEELDRKVEEFLKAEVEDPEVQLMLVSLQGEKVAINPLSELTACHIFPDSTDFHPCGPAELQIVAELLCDEPSEEERGPMIALRKGLRVTINVIKDHRD